MHKWTTFDMATNPPVMRCAGCGAAQPVMLPMKLSEVTSVMDSFERKHANCEKARTA